MTTNSCIRTLTAMRQICIPHYGPPNDDKALVGVNLGHLWEQDQLLRQAMEHLLLLYTQGQIAPIVAQTFPLTEAAAARRYLQERRNIGKVFLTTDNATT